MAAKKHYKRAWLNSTKGIAACEVSYTYYDTDIADADIKITDCNRVVNLEFTFVDNKQKKERRAKLETLIKELTAFKEKLFD